VRVWYRRRVTHADPPPDRRLGQVLLGKYEVRSILGQGGMGVVYDAVDTRLDRPVAIKVLHAPAGGGVSDARARFQREAQVIAKVVHAHLVTLLDYDMLPDGTPAMVMERIDGVNLRELLGSHDFSLAQVLAVVSQCLEALMACHEHGLVHRDLKPENILIAPNESRGIDVKIIDFGLTKLLAGAATTLTVNGQVFGSPRFMAPEQWLSREVDGRTDQYAVALVGIALLRGEHFIPTSPLVEVCRAHVKSKRPPVRRTTAGEPVPAGLVEVLHRGASPNIGDRYPDARAMFEALMPYLDAAGRPEIIDPNRYRQPASGSPLGEASFGIDTADVTAAVETGILSDHVAYDSLEDDDATAIEASPVSSGGSDTTFPPTLEGSADDTVRGTSLPAGGHIAENEEEDTVYVDYGGLHAAEGGSDHTFRDPDPISDSRRVRFPDGVNTVIHKEDVERAVESRRREQAASAQMPLLQPGVVTSARLEQSESGRGRVATFVALGAALLIGLGVAYVMV
jgi:serine/threonine protein kinase